MAAKKPLEPVLIAMNAALYAGVGYLTFLGIFAPVVGTVRFWPSVVIPAVFHGGVWGGWQGVSFCRHFEIVDGFSSCHFDRLNKRQALFPRLEPMSASLNGKGRQAFSSSLTAKLLDKSPSKLGCELPSGRKSLKG
jgi:hypothetical protein